jgi:hypothetical protein
VLSIVKIKTPKGSLEVRIKELDNLFVLAEKIYVAGGFSMPEMKQSLVSYLQRHVPQQITYSYQQQQQMIYAQ